MSWYRRIKTANAQLGTNLGKWLVLTQGGQANEVSVKNDILTFVNSNPTGVDPVSARAAAVNYFVGQTGQQPTPNLLGLLDQWLAMVGGNSISPQPVDDGLGGENGVDGVLMGEPNENF